MGDYVGTGHNVIESDCNIIRHCIFVDKYEMFMVFAFVNLSVYSILEENTSRNIDVICDFADPSMQRNHAISFVSCPQSWSRCQRSI